jgi:hypothetical protein
LLPLPQAAHAKNEGLNVYLFLTGMMIFAELAPKERAGDHCAENGPAPRS